MCFYSTLCAPSIFLTNVRPREGVESLRTGWLVTPAQKDFDPCVAVMLMHRHGRVDNKSKRVSASKLKTPQPHDRACICTGAVLSSEPLCADAAGALAGGAPGGGEGAGVVPVPDQPAGHRRRDCRPLHPVLEHLHRRAAQQHRHRIPGKRPPAGCLLCYTLPIRVWPRRAQCNRQTAGPRAGLWLSAAAIECPITAFSSAAL